MSDCSAWQGNSAPKSRRGTGALELAYYGAVSALAMGRAALQPDRFKFGPLPGGDSLQAIYDYWLRGGAGRARLQDGLNPLLGAPLGEPLVPVSNLHQLAGALLTTAVGPVVAYNLMILTSLALSGWLSHRLVARLTGDRATAFVIGTAFGTSPYIIAHGAHHAGLAQVWVFPLLFEALFRYARRPSWPHTAWLAAASALSMWVHGYYGLFTLLLLGVLVPALELSGMGTDRKELRSAFLRVACIGAIAAANAGIWLAVSRVVRLADDGLAVDSALERSIEELERYGIRWYEFLLPPDYSNFAAAWVRPFIEGDHLERGTNTSETTLYLGAVPLLILATTAFRTLYRRARGAPPAVDNPNAWPRLPSAVRGLLLALIGLPVLLGSPPELELGSFVIPMPSGWLHPVFPMLRALSRWGIVTILAIACVAAIPLAADLRRLGRRARCVSAAALVAVVLVDQLPLRERYSLDTTIVPPWYQAVKALPGDPLIVELPHWNDVNAMPVFWQIHHGKRLFNSNRRDHPHFGAPRNVYRRLVAQRDFAGVLAQAERDGIDYVLLHWSRPLALGESFSMAPDSNAIVFLRHAMLVESR